MNAKQKASELIKKYVEILQKTDSCLNEKCENVISCQHSWYACEGWLKYAKQLAILSVENIMDEHNTYYDTVGENLARIKYAFWKDVKTEIEAFG